MAHIEFADDTIDWVADDREHQVEGGHIKRLPQCLGMQMLR
jgi:hypothetical protein